METAGGAAHCQENEIIWEWSIRCILISDVWISCRWQELLISGTADFRNCRWRELLISRTADNRNCWFQELQMTGTAFLQTLVPRITSGSPLWRVRNLPLLKVYSQDHFYFVVNAGQERDALILNNDYDTLFKLHKGIYGFTSEELSLALRVCRLEGH